MTDGAAPFRSPRRDKAEGGFTLLELLVVVAVVALLVTVVVPWFAGALNRLQADEAADDIVAAMTEARDLAAGRHRTVKVMVDEKAGTIEVEGGRYRSLPAGVALSGPPSGYDGKGIILFHPDGTSDGGQVVASRGDVAWAVSVELLTGQIRRVYAGAR